MQKAVIIYEDRLLLFDGKKFDTIKPSSAKEYRIGYKIPSTSIRSLSFKLPLTLSLEQLRVQVELKMYNEGGLDPYKEYAIDFISHKLEQENSYFIEAFALEKGEFDSYLGEWFKKIGFIDIVYPKFITYTLIVDNKSNDLVLYFSAQEAFGVFFQNGKFVGYRSIDSLEEIAKKVGVELIKLKSLLAQKGLVALNYDHDEKHIFDALQEVMYQNIEKIVYAINFKRSYFGIEHIDKVLIDFEGQEIKGLRDIFLSFGMEGAFHCEKVHCCNLEAKEVSLAIEAAYVAKFDELEQKLNFSFYERKKPWYKYTLVHFAAIFVIFLSLLGGGYIYLFGKSMQLQKEIEQKEHTLAKLKDQNSRFLAIIKKLKKVKLSLAKKSALLQKEIELYQDTLETLPFIQNAKLQREQMINDVIEALYRFALSTKAIEQKGTKHIYVHLLSKNMQREKIAKFMRYLLDKGYKNVQTDEIRRVGALYQSLIKVAR